MTITLDGWGIAVVVALVVGVAVVCLVNGSERNAPGGGPFGKMYIGTGIAAVGAVVLVLAVLAARGVVAMIGGGK